MGAIDFKSMAPMMLPFLLLERVHQIVRELAIAQLGVKLLYLCERRSDDPDVLGVQRYNRHSRHTAAELLPLFWDDALDNGTELDRFVLVVARSRLCWCASRANDLGLEDLQLHVHDLLWHVRQVVAELDNEEAIRTVVSLQVRGVAQSAQTCLAELCEVLIESFAHHRPSRVRLPREALE